MATVFFADESPPQCDACAFVDELIEIIPARDKKGGDPPSGKPD